MKSGLIILVVGFVISIIALYVPIGDGLGNGYLAMFIGYPLILIGLIVIIYKFIKTRK